MRVIRLDEPDDPRVAEYRAVANPRLARRLNLFVAESRLVVERALARETGRPRSLLVTEAALASLDTLAAHERLADVPAYVAATETIGAIAGFHFHQGCLALVERPPRADATALAAAARRVVVTEAMTNPDNVGSIFRNAAAFDVDAVLLSPACGDPLYRKAIRTSMAATLSVPFATLTHWPEDLDRLRDAGFRLLALSPDRAAPELDRAAATLRGERVAVLFGAEGPGLTAAALARADLVARIPTSTTVDSLNVSVAAGIALHALRAANVAGPISPDSSR